YLTCALLLHASDASVMRCERGPFCPRDGSHRLSCMSQAAEGFSLHRPQRKHPKHLLCKPLTPPLRECELKGRGI
ncbi:unnamed protein product, partial [Pleuronectes platessa]